jgi:flagellin-like hook-associated protein FlgL
MGCKKCQKGKSNGYSKGSYYKESSKQHKSNNSKEYGWKEQNDGRGAIRVIHNVAGAPNVDVYIRNKNSDDRRRRILKNVAYKQVSGYLDVSEGTYEVSVTPTGDNTTNLIKQRLSIRSGQFKTAIAVGDVSNLSSLNILVLEDDPRCPKKKHTGKLRVVHAAATVPNVNVAVDDNIILRNVSFGTASDYFTLKTPNVYNIDLIVSASGQTALQRMVSLENRQNLTLIASGLVGNAQTPLTLLPVVDNDTTCVCSI